MAKQGHLPLDLTQYGTLTQHSDAFKPWLLPTSNYNRSKLKISHNPTRSKNTPGHHLKEQMTKHCDNELHLMKTSSLSALTRSNRSVCVRDYGCQGRTAWETSVLGWVGGSWASGRSVTVWEDAGALKGKEKEYKVVLLKRSGRIIKDMRGERKYIKCCWRAMEELLRLWGER